MYIVGLVLLNLGVALGFVWSSVANGDMPLASSRLVLLPSTGWLALTLSGELSWWEIFRGAVKAEGLFKNGSSGHVWIHQCGAIDLPLTGRGGE